jgi:trehalose 6-phosphate synthase
MEPCADLILANRAYVDHELPPGSGSRSEPVNGGLLAAVRTVIAPWDGERGTTWIGAGRGVCDREFTDEDGYELLPTVQGPLRHRRLYWPDEEWRLHYAEVANGFGWPLLHLIREALPSVTGYYPVPRVPSSRAWEAHRAVNHGFAEAAAREGRETCWVHDYQLSLTPAMLRALGFEGRIGFFLHTPFPDVAIVRGVVDVEGIALVREMVWGMLGADLVGLQSARDAERFRSAAVELCGAAMSGECVQIDDRKVVVGAYEIGIDAGEVLAMASSPTPSEAAEVLDHPRPLVVGLERSDYTKGIPERLHSIARTYRRGVAFTYVGIAAPTRAGVLGYEQLEHAIDDAAEDAERAAKEIGAHFLQIRRAIAWNVVVALQREADVVFTSSLADGMNLVPLQAALAQSLRPPESRAVIISGRDAGVSQAYADFEHDGLVATDPLAADELDVAFDEALRGLPGRVSDRLIKSIEERDSRAWATRFLTDLRASRC